MTLKILVSLVSLSITSTTFAKDEDWVIPYLRSKKIQCDLTQAQLRDQVSKHLESNIQQIQDNLKARGADLKAIVRNRAEVGIFPNTPLYDFYVFEKIAATIERVTFPIQTTYSTDMSADAKTEDGLWFPLTVTDSGSSRTCRLSRLTFREDGRRFVPAVDLVLGNPPRVVTSSLVLVMDPASPSVTSPLPTTKQSVFTLDSISPTVEPPAKSVMPNPIAPPPPPAPTPTPTAPVAKQPEPQKEIQRATEEDEEQNAADKKKSRAQLRKERRERRAQRRREVREERRQERRQELREERRRERRDRRRDRRRQRSEETTEEQSASTREPPKPAGCTGNDSPWKTAACGLGLVK